MENNEEIVMEEITENVEEQTTEEIVEPQKIYSEEDLNNRIDEILPKKLNRREAKIRREYEEKYGELESILKQGLNVNSIEEATENLKGFYENKGIKFNSTKPTYSDEDEKYLANRYAEDLIESSTISELEEEIKNLVNKGFENMTSREKVMFTKVDNYIKEEKSKKELAAAGISTELLQDSEFIEFSNKLNPSMSMKDKYEMYKQFKPDKPKVEPMGSMKGTTQKDNGVKEFYTYEEASQFTREDFDKNPELFKAVENSMLKW